jgi:hypothetical protein
VPETGVAGNKWMGFGKSKSKAIFYFPVSKEDDLSRFSEREE